MPKRKSNIHLSKVVDKIRFDIGEHIPWDQAFAVLCKLDRMGLVKSVKTDDPYHKMYDYKKAIK